MSFPLINPSHQWVDTSGSPLVSGTIEFQNPTTSAKINTYPTADDADAQTNANDNPLTLDSRGGFTGIYLEDGVPYKVIIKDSAGATVDTQDDVRCPTHTTVTTDRTIIFPTTNVSFKGTIPTAIVGVQAYTRNATIVEDRTLLASGSATDTNNNNVLAALIADLQQKGIIM